MKPDSSLCAWGSAIQSWSVRNTFSTEELNRTTTHCHTLGLRGLLQINPGRWARLPCEGKSRCRIKASLKWAWGQDIMDWCSVHQSVGHYRAKLPVLKMEGFYQNAGLGPSSQRERSCDYPRQRNSKSFLVGGVLGGYWKSWWQDFQWYEEMESDCDAHGKILDSLTLGCSTNRFRGRGLRTVGNLTLDLDWAFERQFILVLTWLEYLESLAISHRLL